MEYSYFAPHKFSLAGDCVAGEVNLQERWEHTL